MRLSVCCPTSEPGARVRAVLEPLRSVADEVVIAADKRTPREDLAHYGAVADKLFTFEFTHIERIYAWLHAQCEGDWILLIEGDEFASPVLIDRLPELVRQRRVNQFFIPRRWLFPDPGHWLEESPWWPDLSNRLVRNDGSLFFPGTLHSDALRVDPAGFLDAPLYHFPLLEPLDARRRKMDRYAAHRPYLRLSSGRPVNETYYLPEQAARREPSKVPPEDRDAIVQLFTQAAAPTPREPRASPRHVTLSETDRLYAQRGFDPEGYRAEITPFETDFAFAAGEQRGFLFWVANAGSEVWPWGLERPPHIHLTYEMWDPQALLWRESGVITPLPHALQPGDRALMPVTVIAPHGPGRHRIRVDLRHAGHRWFGCGTELEIEVC